VPEVLADTFYWIALLNPADNWHQDAKSFGQSNTEARLVTTEAVLTEVLNYFSGAGEGLRHAAATLCDQTLRHANTVVLPQTREVFTRAFELYQARPDKGYSQTDCISMIEMRSRNITDVLTHDRHFLQEGFNILLP
jgi:uncharacterized protein